MLPVGCNCNVRAINEEVVCCDMLGSPVQSRSFPKKEVLAKTLKRRSNHLSLLPTLRGTDIAHRYAEFGGCQISVAV